MLLVKVLAVDGAVERTVDDWVTTGEPWSYDHERYIIVTPSKSKYTQDDIVEVRVEYDYDILFGAIPTLKDFTFVVKATMRVMYDPEWELS